MIRSFKHKGLRRFYESGSTAGIVTIHAKKLRLILTNLDSARFPSDMNLQSLNLHQLKGDRHDFWSVRVSGNWRVTFRFIEEDVEIVNYEDYH